ncbi:MAG: hypothetical protein E7057_07400 [Lentisphaerae bacterium]|nr:hypothetical protein [Lentisphaerota bacterium]
MFWNKLHIGRVFSVISCDGNVVRGGKFCRKGKMWKMTGFAEAVIAPDNPAAAWKQVARTAGLAEFRVVTGKVAGSSFFRFQSTDMPPVAQRGAVEFELPRHLLATPDKYTSQFCISGKTPETPDGVMVNVAVFPEKSMADFTDDMRQAGVLADRFVHPFLAVDNDLDTLILPEIDPDFGYYGNSWMPIGSEQTVRQNNELWLERLKKSFIFPVKKQFSARDYLPVLLAAEVIVSGKIGNAPDSFKVLPDQVRPVRFRGHLIITALLLAGVIGLLVWRFSLTYGDMIKEYRQITAETKRLKKKTSELKSSIKRNSKEIKEISRIVGTVVGEADAVAEFAVLSERLPGDVLVSSVRWGEKDIDVVVQCEDSNFDFDRHFRSLRYWKVTQQGRQNPDSAVATITLKLSPIEEGK